MSYYFKNLQPGVDESSSEDELEQMLHGKQRADDASSEDDELSSLTFGSLKKAEDALQREEAHEAVHNRARAEARPRGSARSRQEASDSEDSSDSEAGFFEEDDRRRASGARRHKHAPSEQSAKRPVSKVRQIPGLESARREEPQPDIRFDKSLGRAEDLAKVRSNYRFLDDYRQQEISELSALLADKKFLRKASEREVQQLQQRLTSMRSRLQTVQNRDTERQVLRDYERSINQGNKTKFHLKKSEQKKVVQKWKFDHMKARQRDKVMERKRKKLRGKEFRSFEFHRK
ncbi:AFR557Cp [Eremothecium gossypii ATCC 10895]|uniref:rRNA biogenesis protein RRP36 n=1 Tax=Eremothecium gossypii (strain ATCC 10895 / CBS 109.51 / FGSC 9923 / NRRL Y-1056) TaxID=284811 RepID=RRP36_EREGS|nr:AFR557Cp [Eremothecium gossypii ATCC 10895]Q752L7.1 RecName: Full=rRNA biogenesis protein RRP36; AltName: Full=Ribosomal RNA-processing protein 36 [Eremothecium gossypii ATCC 10895]AAS53928.1 AFR557Cp [Eremothecium gossypii ATCC 10895]AEY98241.1 FAFR557Cp [Eremothecium gossypii FDAG1]